MYVVTTWLWLVMATGDADGDGVMSVYVVLLDVDPVVFADTLPGAWRLATS